MRIPVRRTSQLRFNITPLIDIVFLLIIFFLVASHFVRSELQEPIELPAAREGESEPNEIARRLVITIDSANRYLIELYEMDDQTDSDRYFINGNQDVRGKDERL